MAGERLTAAQREMLEAVAQWGSKHGDDVAAYYLWPHTRARARVLIRRGLLATDHDDGSPPQFVRITPEGRAAIGQGEGGDRD